MKNQSMKNQSNTCEKTGLKLTALQQIQYSRETILQPTVSVYVLELQYRMKCILLRKITIAFDEYFL